MSISIGKALDLVELLCKNVDPALSSNHELFRDILNMKLREFAADTGILETKATISSVADQQEYQLPSDKIHVKLVYFDDYKADKITFEQVAELQGKG